MGEDRPYLRWESSSDADKYFYVDFQFQLEGVTLTQTEMSNLGFTVEYANLSTTNDFNSLTDGTLRTHGAQQVTITTTRPVIVEANSSYLARSGYNGTYNFNTGKGSKLTSATSELTSLLEQEICRKLRQIIITILLFMNLTIHRWLIMQFS